MRTPQEDALMEIALDENLWEGESDAPTGSFALVTVDDVTRAGSLGDAEANEWLQSTTDTTYYVVQWDSNGLLYVTEYDEYLKAEKHFSEIEDAYYDWLTDLDTMEG